MRKNIFVPLMTMTLIAIVSTPSFARCIGASINGNCHGMNVEALSDDNDGYTGSSGNSYQYDRNNPSDELRYSIDLEAQRRDQMSLDTGTTLDRGMGQFGGGIYDDE